MQVGGVHCDHWKDCSKKTNEQQGEKNDGKRVLTDYRKVGWIWSPTTTLHDPKIIAKASSQSPKPHFLLFNNTISIVVFLRSLSLPIACRCSFVCSFTGTFSSNNSVDFSLVSDDEEAFPDMKKKKKKAMVVCENKLDTPKFSKKFSTMFMERDALYELEGEKDGNNHHFTAVHSLSHSVSVLVYAFTLMWSLTHTIRCIARIITHISILYW